MRSPGRGFPSLTKWMHQVTLFAVANCNAPGWWPSARTSVAGRHSSVKSQPRKLKGRERSCSRPMPFQQRTNTSCYLAIPTHGFTVVFSVFRGTPPAKPLNCKSVSNRLGARIRSVWAHHAGGTPRHSCDRFRLVLSDILKTSFSFCSQFQLPFALIVYRYISRQQKTLLTLG